MRAKQKGFTKQMIHATTSLNTKMKPQHFDGKKKGIIQGKGTVNNKVSAVFFQLLEENGVPTHFVELLSPTKCW